MTPLRSLWLCFLLLGCASKRKPRDVSVRKVKFEGNAGILSGRADPALEGAMVHPVPGGLWPLRQEVPLDEEALQMDKLRLKNWYADQGFFDASIERWEIRTLREGTEDRPPIVSIVGHVDEGEPTTIREIDWGSPDIAEPILNQIKRSSSLRAGERFSLPDYTETLESIRRDLANRSFAHVEVDGRIEVDRKNRVVDITFDINPGPPSAFGEISLSGAKRVPRDVVMSKIEIEEGRPFNRDDLQKTQVALHGMNTFSTVRVVPQLDGEPRDIVPVQIELRPRNFREVGLGGGVRIENGRQEALGTARFEHTNLFEEAIGWETRVEAGYAVLGTASLDVLTQGLDIATADATGPVLDATTALDIPLFPERELRGNIEARYEQNLEELYSFRSPSISPSVTGVFGEDWTVTVGYELRYHQYTELRVSVEQLVGLGVAPDLRREEYLNTQLFESVIWDTRDDLLRPTRGQRSELTLYEASRALGGQFDYLGASTDLRAYQQFTGIFDWYPRSVVLAGRIGGGWLEPMGSGQTASVPYAQRFTLGGSSSVRGWINGHLGPWVCAADSGQMCQSGPGVTQPDVDTVPLGALVYAMGSAEVRKYWGDMGAVLFTDLGMAWDNPERISEVPIVPSIGSGFRYATPVGPLRFDIAVRTDDLDLYADEPRLWFHLGLGEAW